MNLLIQNKISKVKFDLIFSTFIPKKNKRHRKWNEKSTQMNFRYLLKLKKQIIADGSKTVCYQKHKK